MTQHCRVLEVEAVLPVAMRQAKLPQRDAVQRVRKQVLELGRMVRKRVVYYLSVVGRERAK